MIEPDQSRATEQVRPKLPQDRKEIVSIRQAGDQFLQLPFGEAPASAGQELQNSLNDSGVEITFQTLDDLRENRRGRVALPWEGSNALVESLVGTEAAQLLQGDQ